MAAEAQEIPPGALACLIYTSGTSGLPRGVMLPHRAILSNIAGVAPLARPLKLDGSVYLSYLPLSLWPWQEAVKAAFLDRVDIVATYDECVHSPTTTIRIPSVVVLKDYVKPQRSVAFTRFNLFLRDEFCCQYCGARGDLTFDHVVPRSKGGITSWENVVAACSPCNLRKANRTPAEADMPLRHEPRRPTRYELHHRQPEFDHREYHHTWLDYLYWDSELES